MLNIVLVQLSNLVFQHPAGNIQYASFCSKPSITVWGTYWFLCLSAAYHCSQVSRSSFACIVQLFAFVTPNADQNS